MSHSVITQDGDKVVVEQHVVKKAAIAAVVGGVVVGLIATRKVNKRVAQATLQAAEVAVEAWIDSMEKNGLSIVVLPTKIAEKMATDGFLTPRAA